MLNNTMIAQGACSAEVLTWGFSELEEFLCSPNYIYFIFQSFPLSTIVFNIGSFSFKKILKKKCRLYYISIKTFTELLFLHG